MQIKAVINERGVITIPAALRQSLGLKANDELILEEADGGILMRPAISVPLEVYTEQRIRGVRPRRQGHRRVPAEA